MQLTLDFTNYNSKSFIDKWHVNSTDDDTYPKWFHEIEKLTSIIVEENPVTLTWISQKPDFFGNYKKLIRTDGVHTRMQQHPGTLCVEVRSLFLNKKMHRPQINTVISVP